MNKKTTSKSLLTCCMLLTLLVSAVPEINAGRGGAVAGGVLGGLALGTIIGSAATSRSAYASNEDYINALENENYRLREQNADLRAELRSNMGRNYAR